MESEEGLPQAERGDSEAEAFQDVRALHEARIKLIEPLGAAIARK